MKIKVAIAVLLLCPGITVVSAGGSFIPEYEAFRLDNGLQVVLIENHQQPTVVFKLVILSGSATDSDTLAGLASLSIEMLKAGTEQFPGGKLAAMTDSVGGIMEMVMGRDALSISGDFLSRDLPLSLTMLADMVIRPLFSEETLARIKNQHISWLMQMSSISSSFIQSALFRRIYGDAGYGADKIGTGSGLRRIKREDVVRFHRRYIRPNNAVLIIGGDFAGHDTKQLVTELFADWQRAEDFRRPKVSATVPDSLKILLIDRPNAPMTEFIIGGPAVPVGSDQFPALILLNYILGAGGEVSRLHKDLIQDSELAANVNSTLMWSRESGVLHVQGTAPNDMAADALSHTFQVMTELKDLRIPVRELTEAKRHYLGSIPGGFETFADAVFKFAGLFAFGVDINYHEHLFKQLDGVGPVMMQKTAEEFLDVNHMTIIISGPEDILRRDLSTLAPIDVLRSGSE
ncbi:MAG: insulinase family protein [Candidatus Zixiibacteriota bacterium]|nr:MAG: insulinase family protein [candidate division Zixibacteria bacterium]